MDYNYLVLDLHEHLSAHLPMMALCDRIFTMERDDKISRNCIEQYREILCANGLEQVWEKTIRVNLPLLEDLPARIVDLPRCSLGKLVRENVRSLSGDRTGKECIA